MEVALYNRQRAVALPLERLQTAARAAAELCLAYPGPSPSVLADLASVEIAIVSDRTIARVHRQFLGVAGATDVITFPYGEIAISATTAARQALENDETTARELARYIVHGMLHLHGHEDAGAQDARTMWRAQENIVEAIWPKSPR